MVCMILVCCVDCGVLHILVYHVFFFFKQKTAYEMRISDWSSDVCSSDLSDRRKAAGLGGLSPARRNARVDRKERLGKHRRNPQIGRASCRERVCQYV